MFCTHTCEINNYLYLINRHEMWCAESISTNNLQFAEHPTVSSQLRDLVPLRELDYDVKPTELYRLIESKKFKEILSILDQVESNQGKDDSSCDYRIQANTWIIRRNENGKLRWRILPLHAAIIFDAPLELIKGLIKLAPISLVSKDDIGKLPIHLAFDRDSFEDIIEILLNSCPESVLIRDKKGRLPHQCSPKNTELLGSYASVRGIVEREAIENKMCCPSKSGDVAELPVCNDEVLSKMSDDYDIILEHKSRLQQMKESHKTQMALITNSQKYGEHHAGDFSSAEIALLEEKADYVLNELQQSDDKLRSIIESAEEEMRQDEENASSRRIEMDQFMEMEEELKRDIAQLHWKLESKTVVRSNMLRKLDEVTAKKRELLEDKSHGFCPRKQSDLAV